MRIRSIKPEFWTSYAVAALPEPTALLFVGLWNYVQDNGVGRDDALLIKAALYALREEIHAADVTSRMDDLEQVGLIHRYASGDVALFYVVGWDEHQVIRKASRCKYQRPSTPPVQKKSALVPETSGLEQGAGSREQGDGAGSREQGIGAARAAEQKANPMGEIMQAVRQRLYIPDGKPPRDWNESRCASIAKRKLDGGTPVGEILDAIEGLAILRDSGELDWLKRGHKTTLRALYHTHSGAVPVYTLALNALDRANHHPTRKAKSQPTALGDILGTIRGAA